MAQAFSRERISGDVVLAVEGRDEFSLLLRLLDEVGLKDAIQLHDLGGRTSLRERLSALATTEGFERVQALGLLRDAEEKPAQFALQSISDALRDALGVPSLDALAHAQLQTHEAQGRRIRFGAFIAPDGQSPGMLEDLCLRPGAVASDPAMECVNQYLECLATKGVTHPDWAKRRLHAFLASRDKPGLKVGEAAQARYWHFDDPVWAPLKQFLRDLAGA